jgi:hypothetical protein
MYSVLNFTLTHWTILSLKSTGLHLVYIDNRLKIIPHVEQNLIGSSRLTAIRPAASECATTFVCTQKCLRPVLRWHLHQGVQGDSLVTAWRMPGALRATPSCPEAML